MIEISSAFFISETRRKIDDFNSYETQKNYYTERINAEPNWTLVGIFADKGITGTSVKNRDEFNKMIKLCKRGKVDMIITKSISRFARNTLDCLKYTRMLKAIGVDVSFEEQGIHSTQPGAEFYITIYGTADARGRSKERRKSCGGASADSTTARNTATNRLRWKKAYSKKLL